MGSIARRTRQRDRVRRTILTAARDLAASAGYDRVSMRKIADRIEYTAAAIYSYFPNKEAILLALAEDASRRLAQHLDAVADDADPLTRLRDRVWRFYTFSKSHPEDFKLMFIERSVAGTEQRYERFLRTTSARAEVDVRGCIAQGQLRKTVDAAAALRLLCAGMLGAAMMRRTRGYDVTDADVFARQLLDILLAGLGAVRDQRFATCGASDAGCGGGCTSSSNDRSCASSAGGNT
jgi:AcrR family transcriptional regulator